MILIKKAIRYAIEAHKNQSRKGTVFPYVEHPIHVGMLLLKANQREEVVVAGILHDTVEDTEVTEKDLLREFGEEVMLLVRSASEPDRELTWKERKDHTIEFLSRAPYETKMIGLCDKLSNLMDMEADFLTHGDSLWDRFKVGYEGQGWYYRSLVRALDELEGHELYTEFKDRVTWLFGKGQ